MSVIALFVTASLAQNVVLVHFFGVWPYPSVVYSPRRGAAVAGAVALVLVWVSTVYGVVHRLFLARFALEYLETLTLVLILLGTVYAVVRIAGLVAPYARAVPARYAPLLILNTTVFVVAMSIPESVERITFFPVAALGAGAGLFLALVPIAAIRRHLDRARIPGVLRGDVSAYIATALTALAIQQIDRLVLSVLEPLW